ncbi:hypothetical protein E2562_012383 [Oryza meyeriana var. granulata]|uniref:Uncharacterized protein n=1 Tax=Oryza meyeriana var. granulata TaxID=110450 RepID=A0A6G1C539_9ORYZ|nr:hypothetical protein E2562_012383 [Oryza meyeriana var. granulata]
MTERKLNDMMAALAGLFRWDLLLNRRAVQPAPRCSRARSGGMGDDNNMRMMMTGKKEVKKGSIVRKDKKARRKKVNDLRLDM